MDAFVSGTPRYQEQPTYSSSDESLPLENLVDTSDEEQNLSFDPNSTSLSYPRSLQQSFSQPPISKTPDNMDEIFTKIQNEKFNTSQFDQLSSVTTLSNLKSNTGINFYDSFTLKFVLEEESDVMCVKFKNKRLFVGLASGQTRIYASPNKNVINCQYILEDDETYKNSVTSLDFVDEDLLLVTYVNGLVKFWHVTSKQCLNSIHEKDSESLACSVDKNGKFFYTTGDNGVFGVNRYDVETRKLVSTYNKSSGISGKIDGHVRRVFSVKCNPVSENYFITAGWDDTIQYWDVRQPHAVKRIIGPHVCSESGLDISKDGQKILAGSWRRFDNIEVFDWASGKVENSIKMSTKQFPVQPYSVKFIDKRTIGVGTSSENTVMTFDIENSKGKGYDIPLSKMSNLPGGVYSFDFILQDARKSEEDEMDLNRVFAVASRDKVLIVKENRLVNSY